jgi:hypothetical protein
VRLQRTGNVAALTVTSRGVQLAFGRLPSIAFREWERPHIGLGFGCQVASPLPFFDQ